MQFQAISIKARTALRVFLRAFFVALPITGQVILPTTRFEGKRRYPAHSSHSGTSLSGNRLR
jgi:hypothetical protein